MPAHEKTTNGPRSKHEKSGNLTTAARLKCMTKPHLCDGLERDKILIPSMSQGACRLKQACSTGAKHLGLTILRQNMKNYVNSKAKSTSFRTTASSPGPWHPPLQACTTFYRLASLLKLARLTTIVNTYATKRHSTHSSHLLRSCANAISISIAHCSA